MTADTRVWMYRKGEARLFASPADVPKDEGWQDSPPSPDAPDKALEPKPAKVKKKAEAHGDNA